MTFTAQLLAVFTVLTPFIPIYVNAQEGNSTIAADFGTLMCDGVNAFDNQPLNSIIDDPFAISVVPLSLTSPIYNSMAQCNDDDDSSTSSTGYWFGLIPTTQAGEVFTIVTCATPVDDSGETSALSGGVRIAVYTDDIIKENDDTWNRGADSTCQDLTTCVAVSTTTTTTTSDVLLEASPLCNQGDSVVATTTLNAFPFYDYFVYIYFPAIQTPAAMNFYIAAETSDFDGSPSNDYVPEYLGILNGNSNYQEEVDGTLDGATADAVPNCNSTDQELIPLDGVWYRGEPIFAGLTYTASVCGDATDNAKLWIYVVNDSSSNGGYQCVLTGSANCKQVFESANTDDHYFYVYGDDESDFTVTIKGGTSSAAAGTLSGVLSCIIGVLVASIVCFVG